MDPIDKQYREDMNRLARMLDEFFNPGYFKGKQPRKIAFTLFMSPFAQPGDTDSRVNYISNANRAESLAQLKEWIGRVEGRVHGEPETKQ